MSAGPITRVNGPLVEVVGLGAAMLELVEVGGERLPGEVIALDRDVATVQVHEHTGGLRPGDIVRASGHPLSALLAPGLLGGVFDGMMRPLAAAGEFLSPRAEGRVDAPGRTWRFIPSAREGDHVAAGHVLGRVPETVAIDFRVLVPVGVGGTVDWITDEGDHRLDDTIATVGGRGVQLATLWPIRRARPIHERTDAVAPLRTGQRVLDLIFPVARGSTAAVVGAFGTGKTLLLQQIAKWCDADVIVYVGCGERGNELADVLTEFAELEDPRTGRPLRERTVILANTSNMPLMARETSVHAGVTVAELYRDMGFDTVVIADSTSRWAEALREVASRKGELPAEEGYPAGLSTELASFYERAGRVRTLGGDTGSVTVLGAVSPPGNDMAEPVTVHTRRFVRALWSLDRDLAYARHYPAVSWRDSYSRDAELERAETVGLDHDWAALRAHALRLLANADRVESMAELVGVAALPGREQALLRAARLLRDAVLKQNALSRNDGYCTLGKGAALLEMALALARKSTELAEAGVPPSLLERVDLASAARLAEAIPPDATEEVGARREALLEQLDAVQE